MVSVLEKVKAVICNYVIVREWIENGEFFNTDIIIVVGTKWQAVMANIAFRGSGEKVYYAIKSNEKYHYRERTKWIVFDRKFKNRLSKNNFDILFVPKL